MAKPDISTKKLQPWDRYKDRSPEDAASAIYAQVGDASLMMCTWYWTSIRTKRMTSWLARGMAFLGLLLGTILPIFAALQTTDGEKLLFTQWAIALLASSGLILVGDRVFGWSSGWMRYITTVTTMENLTRAFQREWGKFLMSKTTALDAADAKALFELASELEHELTKLQADETTKWCAEFNTGISLLETMIKTQREETDKKLDAIHTSLTTQQQATKTEEKSRLPGAVEITIAHKAEPKKVRIAMDKETPQDFVGTIWSKSDVAPGIHVLRVQTTADPPITIERIIELSPSSVARTEVTVP